MLSLADLQMRFAEALRTDSAWPRRMLRAGPCPVEECLDIYRANVIGAVTNALALSHPTVVRLVGESFFGRLGRDYAFDAPPRSGCLWHYGDGFADFLARDARTHALPYLADVARLDRILDRVGNAAPSEPPRRFVLDARTQLELESSLQLLELEWPADEIRAAIERDEDLLEQIDLKPVRRTRVVWRSASGVMMRPLGDASYAFLRALLDGASVEEAFLAAIDHAPQAVGDMDQEVLRAPYARVSLIGEAAS
ncbi:MAG: putative DNA-binding domain-containing protein [Proteobacteria bacterium]|nr:putative DNA-binding domain-containing protein [Pseudomonadota bacterium]